VHPADGIADHPTGDAVILKNTWWAPIDPCSGLGGDTDGDGVCDDNDNCLNDSNPDQSNVDSDSAGDVCDVCPDDDTDTCNPNGSTGSSIGSDGGTLTTPNGNVTIIVPPGALNTDTSLSITEIGTDYELSTNQGNGTAVFGASIQPDGLVFNLPITIIFSWDDADNDGWVDGTNIKEENLKIIKDGVAITGKCKDEPGCDMTANTFTFEVSSLSEFALAVIDLDGDGYTEGEGDCDDADPNISPAASEVCDGIDNNCDGNIDEGFDSDGDTVADCFDNCPADANTDQLDSDNDDIGDVCDICPLDPENDSDSDGVCGDIDICAGTVIPEQIVPSVELGVNRFALIDDDNVFDTVSPGSKGTGNGKVTGPEKSFTTEDTGGCSCEQILAANPEEQKGHIKHGCSISIMEEWISQF
jgi:hypothetical protein